MSDVVKCDWCGGTSTMPAVCWLHLETQYAMAITPYLGDAGARDFCCGKCLLAWVASDEAWDYPVHIAEPRRQREKCP